MDVEWIEILKNEKGITLSLYFINYLRKISLDGSLSLVRKRRDSDTAVTYEWEMRNFSMQFNPQTPELENPKIQEDQKRQHNTEEEEEEEERSRCDWEFTHSTVVSSGTAGGATDTIGVIEFDPSDTLVVTGGIARKIRVYSVKTLLPEENHEHGEHHVRPLEHNNACDYYIYTPAKLSSLRWKPGFSGGILGAGDYDGVVTEYDLHRKIPIFERDEHGGRRVWSVDYSHWDPFVGASGSDDGTVQMWDSRCDATESIAKVRPSAGGSAAVCCVEFNPYGDPLVAVGCADRRAYGYDVRKMADPVLIFDGHQKPVAYVRFMDERMMVTSGTDGSLRLWSMDDGGMIRVYMGHVNTRNFVGLSVWRTGGLLGCGSENNHVFVYDKRWGDPVWVHGFEGGSRDGYDPNYVSSVCWRQSGEDGCTLVAGGSDGSLQVIVGKRRAF